MIGWDMDVIQTKKSHQYDLILQVWTRFLLDLSARSVRFLRICALCEKWYGQ